MNLFTVLFSSVRAQFRNVVSLSACKNVKIGMYKTIIFPPVLYGCETWALILTEEHRPRVFEEMVLRRIFGPKSAEIIGGWRKMHNEELLNLYSLPNKIRMKSRCMRWAGHGERMG
jgi:hypothetical protein